MVEDLQASLPTQFVQDIFSLDSPVLMLRYMASEKVCGRLSTIVLINEVS